MEKNEGIIFLPSLLLERPQNMSIIVKLFVLPTQYKQMAADDGQQQKSVYCRMELCEGYLVVQRESEIVCLLITIVPRISMLRGSPVTTAWRVLRLRMEETASRYGG
jgi:hypothetical protein